MNAVDPHSVCGLGLESFKGVLPKRTASTRIAFRGNELLLEVHRQGKALVFHADPADPDLNERALDPLRRRYDALTV